MTIRIFIGCSANGEDAEMAAMLEYTLRHYASEPLGIALDDAIERSGFALV